ncbi:MAG: hypothetical protein IPJ82_09690 [Lewinellaceae bacterium]|nr:hypothetical protein [Lewinellaceae bacterium]
MKYLIRILDEFVYHFGKQVRQKMKATRFVGGVVRVVGELVFCWREAASAGMRLFLLASGHLKDFL